MEKTYNGTYANHIHGKKEKHLWLNFRRLSRLSYDVTKSSAFGGVQALANQPGAIVDYGSLIYLTLQRAETAREAIQTMAKLMDTYGYASEGESISIADALGEVWIMEVIGRGPSYPKIGGV